MERHRPTAAELSSTAQRRRAPRMVAAACDKDQDKYTRLRVVAAGRQRRRRVSCTREGGRAGTGREV
jgi:hypothetical protein